MKIALQNINEWHSVGFCLLPNNIDGTLYWLTSPSFKQRNTACELSLAMCGPAWEYTSAKETEEIKE